VTLEELVAARIESMYHDQSLGCAHATLRILAEVFDIELSPQVYDSSVGMLGGGGHYGAQCGLVQGALMFTGILGARGGLDEETLDKHCFDLLAGATRELGSLVCREIRPEGFADDNPSYICEPRSVESIVWAARFLADRFQLPLSVPERR
jgi:hypothetical protein